MGVSEQLQCDCPRCAELNGGYPDGKFNLEINTANNMRVFRCWKCEDPRFSGSLGRLVRLYGSNIDYEMYKAFAGQFQDYLYDEEEAEYVRVKLPDEIIFFSQMESNNADHFEAYNYLINDRKINREIILRYRLGFCLTGKYAKRIIIPSYDVDGDVNYFVARNYDKSDYGRRKPPYRNPKSDKFEIIFNEGMVNWDSTIYLVEGAFEMLTFPVNIIPMLGKNLSLKLYKKLKEYKPNVVVLLDPDAFKNCIDLFYLLQTIYIDNEDKVKLVKLPEKKDLDEIRKDYGIEKVLEALYSARGLVVDDYFERELKKPYVYNGTRKGFDFDHKNQQW